MQLIPRSQSLSAYLQVSAIVDFHDAAIQTLAIRLRMQHGRSTALIRATFEWVRDHIRHSWDAQTGPVTLCASEVLANGLGYCYSKSHLLAALLRANGIPTGFCYQRLAVGQSGAPYCLHGLNAVLLPDHGWYRVDARGNKPGVDARFAPPVEQLAFRLQDAHERDFPDILAEPHPLVVAALRSQPDIFALHDALPDAVTLEPAACR